MVEEEQERVIGALVLQRQTLKRLRSCLQTKAHTMSEHLLFAHQVLRKQRKGWIDGGRLVVETEPGQHAPLVLPTVPEIQAVLGEMEDVATRLADTEARCRDLDL